MSDDATQDTCGTTAAGQGDRDDFLTRVKGWVETSGHALEMRVAQAFSQSRHRPQVLMSYSYKMDGTTREGDVRVVYDVHPRVDPSEVIRIELAIECKGDGNKPWVLFHGPGRRVGRDLSAWNTGRWRSECPLTGWGGWPPFNGSGASSTGSAFTEQKNWASDAVRQAVSAAKALGKTPLTVDNRGTALFPDVVAALVITRAPLFEATFNTSTGQIDVRRVDYGDVLNPDGDHPRVAVVGTHYLDQLVEDIDRIVDTAEDLARPLAQRNS